MTQEEYDRTIATGEMQLSGFWAKVAHFSLAICFLIIPVALPCMHLFDYFRGDPSFFQPEELWFIFIPIIISALIYWVQKRSLRFKVIQTTLTRVQVAAIIQRVAVELEWKGDFITNDIYKAKTHPGFFSGSWGEEITLLLAGNRVFINSVCDPDRKTSLTAYGRNQENENTVIESIKRAEQIVAKE